jgi:hypothetical protein
MPNRRYGHRPTPILALLLGLCLTLELSHGGTLYRYLDNNGNVVLNSTIPPEFVGQGYQVLNEKGRLMETVPPALTAEQIAARDAERMRQQALEAEHKRQLEIDQELKLLYSHPNDLVRTLRRRILDIQGVLQLRHTQIEAGRREISELEGRAADAQRQGREIPDSLIGSIARLRKEIANNQADIEQGHQEMARVLEEFDANIQRMEVITDQQASDYPALLEGLRSGSLNALPETAAPTNPVTGGGPAPATPTSPAH